MTEDVKGHRGVRFEEVLNNLLGQGIKKKVHLHWEGDPLAKAEAGLALGILWGRREGDLIVEEEQGIQVGI